MTDNLTETEVKLYVPDFSPVIARLDAARAHLEAERVFERNVRYVDTDHNFLTNGVVLRLRADSRYRLTYKEPPRMIEGIMSRFEAEVTVDDFDVMDLILKRLGFVPYVTYEKYRTTYVLNGAEVVLDEMPYGNFVEIEGEIDTIRAALATLGLTNAPRVGMSYLVMFQHIKQVLGLEMHDLTFANFEGVVVPASAIPARG